MLGDVLAGADERVREAGAILAGGHTIRDTEPKYGLAVVGTVHPQRIWSKAGAQPGDVLFLTKLWERGSSSRRGETESHPQERSRRRSSRCSS